MHRITLFLTLILLSPTASLALRNPSDTATARRDSTRVSFFYNNFEQFGFLDIHPNDTALPGFQNYDPLLRHDRFFATLGNLGQNHRSLLSQTVPRRSGFDYGVHSSDGYLFQNDSVKYYRVFKTFSELLYTQGPKKEQLFNAVFSRNIYRGLNLGFNLRVLDSPGSYTRQKTNHFNVVVTAQFLTKNKRYGVIANFLYNRLKNFENGGIKYDSVFDQNRETNRRVIPVWLDKAQNRIKESGFYMKHYFDLNRHLPSVSDTTASTRKPFELGRITYSFHYNRQIQNYLDNNLQTAYYQNIYLDSLSTYDSITVNKIINEVTWSNPSYNRDKKYRILQLEAGVKFQYIEVSDHDLRNYLIQYIPHAAVYFQPIRSLLLVGNADFVFGDYNEGDFSINVRLTQTLGSVKKNIGNLSLNGSYSMQKPGWFYAHYAGNNFMWDHSWKQQSFISGGASYAWKFLDAGFSLTRIDQFVYLDTAATPQQFDKQFGLFYCWLNGDLPIGRFRIQGRLAYQTVQGTSVLRVPAFVGSMSLYYSQPLFHGAAVLEPGFNFLYNTRYYGDAYMPATRSFYLQDQREIGNYLYMDIFINLKIQRARFFVMYSNFNSWFMAHDYYTVPHYPMQDAAFRFGITWRFHD